MVVFWYASSIGAKKVKEKKEKKEKEYNKTFFFILKSIRKHIRIIFMM